MTRRGGGSRILVATMCLGQATPALAETVRLKNGTVLSGSVVSMTETELTIDTADMGQIVVKRRAVQAFEDDAGKPVTPAMSAPAAMPPVVISNNNNNNNNNNLQQQQQQAPAVAATPAPAATALAPALEPEHDEPGILLGTIGAGVAYARFRGNRGSLENDWARPTPIVHWDFIGYRWGNGLSFTLFGEGSRRAKSGGWNQQWLAGGGRFDATLGRHTTRLGTSAFRVGLGAAHAQLDMKGSDGSNPVNGYYYYYGYSNMSGDVEMERSGAVGVASLGFQFLGSGGLGVSLDLATMQGRLSDQKVKSGQNCNYYWNCDARGGHPTFETVGMTLGMSYVL